MKGNAKSLLKEAQMVLGEAERSIKDARRKAQIKAIKMAGKMRDHCEQVIVQQLKKAGLPKEVFDPISEDLDQLEETMVKVLSEAFMSSATGGEEE